MTMGDGAPYKKENGVRHFLAAARYSWQGFLRLSGEAAFRQELGGFVLGLILLGLLGAGLGSMLVFVMLMLALFAIEAINTAIEELVDRVSPEYSSVGKHAKDLGSFAVSCLIAVNGLYIIYMVYTLFWG
jgi:diacylglycerol kinase (ATP)